jgi:hypothetical protein
VSKMCTKIFHIDFKKNIFGDLILNTRTINSDYSSSINPQKRVVADKTAIAWVCK